MRDYRDAKAMAHTLRAALAENSISVSHSQSLELIARVLGCASWHVLSAALSQEPVAGGTQHGQFVRQTRTVPLLPVRDYVLLPKFTAPLFLGRDTSKRALAHARKGPLEVALVLQKRPDDESPALDSLYAVGVVADVIHRSLTDEGHVRLVVRSRARVRIEAVDYSGGFSSATIRELDEEDDDDRANLPDLSSAVGKFRGYLNKMKEPPPETVSWLEEISHPGVLADLIAQQLPLKPAERQPVLETLDANRRLALVLELLDKNDGD